MMTTADGRKQTTGIGSLPHHNIDAALEFSFRLGIPFLPQIPIRNPWEYMIAQALEGLPGLQAEDDGAVRLNVGIWQARAHELTSRLGSAFARADSDAHAFEAFEPTAPTSRCWQPFLWELEERGLNVAKIQIAGPMTAQWALQFNEPGASIERHPELSTQIFRLVLARALAMSRRLRSTGIQPILYLDEPGLYAFSPGNPKHVLALQELRLVVATLRKEGVVVGLHCCSNADWGAVLGLKLDVLSIDAGLSLGNLLGGPHAAKLEQFVLEGGKLSLGVIPTGRSSALRSLDARELFAEVLERFGHASGDWATNPGLARRVLADAIYTPACGLALHSAGDAELVLELLGEFHELALSSLTGRPVGRA